MSAALDRFFAEYYRLRPVNATFAGVHEHDHLLPDWSPGGLEELGKTGEGRREWDSVDAELASGFLEIQAAEGEASCGVRRNPALWTGEAVFSLVSLMIRPFAPLDARVAAAAARLDAVPGFLAQACVTMGERPVPAPWTERALRECEGARLLLSRGVGTWLASGPHAATEGPLLRAAAARALDAFGRFAGWLRARPPADADALACGGEFFDLLLARGHLCVRSRADLLAEARARLAEARATLAERARATCGSWEEAQERTAADHPAPDDYLSAFGRTWEACRAVATEHGVVTWPDWPIRYVPFPEWTREAAPLLYYLHYRSPAPGDPYDVYDYVVPPLPAGSSDAHLRAWNNGVIKLNHVVHHGAIGHHVQNWHAYHRSRSRIGRLAAVDCASRIAMFCGGTMAEGWACYATELMEELGFLDPLERLSQQHARVRFLARAVVDIELHQRSMSFGEAVRFYCDELGMGEPAARAEATRNSMFPGTGIMYWLGTQGILDLRDALRQRRGPTFSLRGFHDEFLAHGSIPVPLIARLMTAGAV